jgi:hypothetical protein
VPAVGLDQELVELVYLVTNLAGQQEVLIPEKLVDHVVYVFLFGT